MTNWFKKLLPSAVRSVPCLDKRGVPEGVWTQCSACQAVLFREEYKRHLCVCTKCGHHGYWPARARLESFLDAEPTATPVTFSVPHVDKLRFKDTKKYKDRLYQAKQLTGEQAALIARQGHLMGRPVVAVAFEFRFIGGSMGAMVGEGFVQAVQSSLTHRCPLICFSSSGGARMQEGLVSLFQMAKTSAVLTKLAQAGLPFISVLTHPTMGGVSASLAFLGDIIIAEPGALVGFAGPRVIAQTVKETLPEGFQRSEFLLEKGAIDCILSRGVLRERIASMLHLLLPPTSEEQGG